jgi:hypothetical protein
MKGGILIQLLVSLSNSYPTRVMSCFRPGHGRPRPPLPIEASVSIDRGELIIWSSRPIRGFLVDGGEGVKFVGIPDFSVTSDICNREEDRAVFHTLNIDREEPFRFTFECTSGQDSTDMTIYLVSKYKDPSFKISQRIPCPT